MNALAGSPNRYIHPVHPAEASSSVPLCCQETLTDDVHEEEKAVICQEVPPLDRSGLTRGHVFG
jgi:hypothetical protein